MNQDLNLCRQALKLAYYCFFLTRHGGGICPWGSGGQPHTQWVLVLMAVGTLHGCVAGEGFPGTVLAIHLDMLFTFPFPTPAVCHAGDRSIFFASPSANGFILYTLVKLLFPIEPLLGSGGSEVPAPMEHGRVNWHGFNV